MFEIVIEFIIIYLKPLFLIAIASVHPMPTSSDKTPKNITSMAESLRKEDTSEEVNLLTMALTITIGCC